MKKISFFAVFIAAGAMMVSCASSSSEKSENDSVVVVETEVVAEEVADSAQQTAGEVISYGGKLKDVPAGALLTSETIKQSGHPTLIEFGAVWCGPCKQAKPIVEALAAKYEGKAEFLYVDIDNCPAIAEEFGIVSIPTVILAKADGSYEKVQGLDGVKGKLEEKLKSLVEK